MILIYYKGCANLTVPRGRKRRKGVSEEISKLTPDGCKKVTWRRPRHRKWMTEGKEESPSGMVMWCLPGTNQIPALILRRDRLPYLDQREVCCIVCKPGSMTSWGQLGLLVPPRLPFFWGAMLPTADGARACLLIDSTKIRNRDDSGHALGSLGVRCRVLLRIGIDEVGQRSPNAPVKNTDVSNAGGYLQYFVLEAAHLSGRACGSGLGRRRHFEYL